MTCQKGNGPSFEGYGDESVHWEERYHNRIAAALAAEPGLSVNDLFAEGIDHPEYFCPDGVHFGEVGQAALGARFAEAMMQTDSAT